MIAIETLRYLQESVSPVTKDIATAEILTECANYISSLNSDLQFVDESSANAALKQQIKHASKMGKIAFKDAKKLMKKDKSAAAKKIDEAIAYYEEAIQYADKLDDDNAFFVAAKAILTGLLAGFVTGVIAGGVLAGGTAVKIVSVIKGNPSFDDGIDAMVNMFSSKGFAAGVKAAKVAPIIAGAFFGLKDVATWVIGASKDGDWKKVESEWYKVGVTRQKVKQAQANALHKCKDLRAAIDLSK